MIYKFAALALVMGVAYANLEGDEDTKEFTHPPGYCYVAPKDIPKGCARFYISDPIVETQGTKYWQVCTQVTRDHAAKMSIGSGVFEKLKDSWGQETTNSVSFISTGPSTWVDIYSQRSQEGQHYEISPLRDVDLALVGSMDNPDQTTWNDNVMSGFIRSSDSLNENPDGLLNDVGIIPVAVWYRFAHTGRVEPEDGCAYFYDRDPTQDDDSNGFATCVSHDQHLAHISEFDLADRGLILRGDQPYNNGTISSKQEIGAGPQDENGDPLHMAAAEPWTGDEAHAAEADKKYHRDQAAHKLQKKKKLALRRSLQAVENMNNSTNSSLLEIIEEDLEIFWEETVEMADWLFDGIYDIFAGEAPEPEHPVSPSASEPSDSAGAAAPVKVDPDDHTGIRYVEVGADVDAALWTNNDFSGKQSLFKTGTAKAVEGNVNSFFLISKVYSENKPKPEGGYQDVYENPEVPQPELNAEESKVKKVAKKLNKMVDKEIRSKSRRQAKMMRDS
jgi:hypothetical protein